MVSEKQEQEYVEHLNKKFPHINPVEGEDLNLQRNVQRILTKCWTDRGKYPNSASIQFALGISERSIYRLVRFFGLPRRNTLTPTPNYECIPLKRVTKQKKNDNAENKA